MLDLRSSHKKLHHHYQRFLDDGFPPGLTQKDFAAFDASVYPEEMLERGRRAWQLRTLDEYRSQVAFTELLADITELKMPFDTLATCVRVIRDEARHVELCRRMVVALGGDNLIAGEPGWVHTDPNLPIRTRILRIAVGSLCIGETISVRMLSAVRNKTEDELAKRVITCLVSDESIHSRFGWTLFELIAPYLKPDERDGLIQLLPGFFRVAERAVVPADAYLHDDAEPLTTGPTSPFGYLPVKERADLFYETLHRDVIARFESFGFPAQQAWEQRAASR